jgi:hypothetical protein
LTIRATPRAGFAVLGPPDVLLQLFEREPKPGNYTLLGFALLFELSCELSRRIRDVS